MESILNGVVFSSYNCVKTVSPYFSPVINKKLRRKLETTQATVEHCICSLIDELQNTTKQALIAHNIYFASSIGESIFRIHSLLL